MLQSPPNTLRRFFLWVARLLFGGMFLYAGYSKIFTPTMIWKPFFAFKFSIISNLSSFQQQVASYKLLSESSASFVAHTLPFAEIALGLLLLIGWRLKIWSAIVSLLLTGFLAAIIRAYMLGLQINCGCFATPEPLTKWTIVRDGIFLLLAILLTIFAFQESRKPHPWMAPASEPS